MISGCAGALAVVIKVMMEDSGPVGELCPSARREYLLFTMVLTGILQLVCGIFQCAVLVRFIPKTAFLGFFNGLAVVIFMSQLDTFRKQGSVATSVGGTCGSVLSCSAVDFGFQSNREWYGLHEQTTWLMLVHVVVIMAVIELLPRIPPIPLGKYGKLPLSRIMPPSLVGLLVCIFIEWVIYRPSGVQSPVVSEVSRIKGDLPQWHVPDVPWDQWDTWKKCLPTAFSLCAIGLVESVLTLQAVDQILDEHTSVPKKNQECLAQGVANLVSGFFQSMGGDAMIGQSTINVMNGAKGRLSAVTDACFLLLYITQLNKAIESIPTAALAGILFVVVIHTFNWPSLSILLRRALPLYMCATIIIVTILSVVTNLAIGIGVGIVWECLFHVWNAALELEVKEDTISASHKTYQVVGDVFFANTDDFNAHFRPTTDPDRVTINLANSSLLDYSALFMLNALGRRYELAKKQLNIEMKPIDYQRYKDICDESAPEDGCTKRYFPTYAVKAVEGHVRGRSIMPQRLQEFADEENPSKPPMPNAWLGKGAQAEEPSAHVDVSSKQKVEEASPPVAICRSCKNTGVDMFGKPCSCAAGKKAQTAESSEKKVEEVSPPVAVCRSCKNTGKDMFGNRCSCAAGRKDDKVSHDAVTAPVGCRDSPDSDKNAVLSTTPVVIQEPSSQAARPAPVNAEESHPLGVPTPRSDDSSSVRSEESV